MWMRTTVFSLLLLLLAPGTGRAAAPEGSAAGTASAEVRRFPPLTVSAEMELFAGVYRMPYDRMALPLGAYLTFDAHTPHRDSGAMAMLGLGLDPLGPDGDAAVLGLEVFHRGLGRRVDVRLGRLDVFHGGRFRFVDGADVKVRIVDHLHVAVWGGTAWHPERTGLFSGGSTWGVDLSYRSALPVGGGVRYDHVMGEDGSWTERVGADVSLHLPRAAGLVIEARADALPVQRGLELGAVAAELRPHHRVHLRLEGGINHPVADFLGRGGAIYPLFLDGPTAYLDGRARFLSLPVADDREPGVRVALGASSHPGKRWRHVIRGSLIRSPGGTATTVLGEVGRRFGPVNVGVVAEQAFYEYEGRPWRAVTHLGTQLGVQPGQAVRMSLTGQLELGRGPEPEGQLLLYVDVLLQRGSPHRPRPTRDRYLSPWSPYHWDRDRMPRAPGTVPGADPYPSMPMGAEAADGS